MLRLDGKILATELRPKLLDQVAHFIKSQGRPPGLAVVVVGDDPASQVYVSHKIKTAQDLGIVSKVFRLSPEVESREIIAQIEQLNQDPQMDRILLQLPLPPVHDAFAIMNRIDPRKDVDGFTVANIGRLVAGRPHFVPCTPAGVMALLAHHQLSVRGLHAVVVGRSQIVGLPMLQLLQQQGATVSLCHSQTQNLKQFTQAADLVVVAVGRPHFLNKADFKADAIVVDVGIHRYTDPTSGSVKLIGDVDPTGTEAWLRALTPVPGGVGPMTIHQLMVNTVQKNAI